MTRASIGGFVLLALLAGAVVVVLWLLLTLLPPKPIPQVLPGGLGAPLTLDQFKLGLGCRESRGDYEARNDRTRAIGKYQMLPVNWRAWSRRWLGDPRAEPTPDNQEIVSTGKIRELWRGLDGNWAVMAHWWLTGSEDTDRSAWSAYANGYVDDVLRVAMASQTMPGRTAIPLSCFSTPDDPFPAAPPTLGAPGVGASAMPTAEGSPTP